MFKLPSDAKCAYDLAMQADQDYSDLITALYGPKATRWTITAAQHIDSRINAALCAKLDADEALLAVFAASREAR